MIKYISVIGKRGTGKTTTAVALAAHHARAGEAVRIVPEYNSAAGREQLRRLFRGLGVTVFIGLDADHTGAIPSVVVYDGTMAPYVHGAEHQLITVS